MKLQSFSTGPAKFYTERRREDFSSKQLQSAIDSAIRELVPACGLAKASRLDNALRYALFPGGKRLRPMLTLIGARIFQSDLSAALAAACAVEFVHTSSLIFDDLPCMDDADFRRGIRALHRVYGQHIAILAGVALLNEAYAIFGRTPALIREATECIGVKGMIGGQALDLVPQREVDTISGAERAMLMAERNRKTSAMMRLALTAGPLACGASASEVQSLGAAGESLGEAYQICDDLLDTAQDRPHDRPTLAAIDAEEAFRQVRCTIEKMRRSLQLTFGADGVAELMGLVDGLFEPMITAAGQAA